LVQLFRERDHDERLERVGVAVEVLQPRDGLVVEIAVRRP
jgi:hypothetical protein